MIEAPWYLKFAILGSQVFVGCALIGIFLAEAYALKLISKVWLYSVMVISFSGMGISLFGLSVYFFKRIVNKRKKIV